MRWRVALTLLMSCESVSPWTYSSTKKSSFFWATTSSVGTTFGCRMREASRASSTNMDTKPRSETYCGSIRLIATVREKPIGPSRRPRCTVAIPPDAILS